MKAYGSVSRALFRNSSFLASSLLTGLLLVGGALAAFTQNSVMTTPEFGESHAATDAPSIIVGKPFVAHRMLHTKRILADGTPAAHDFPILEARDSQGRTVQQMQGEIPATATRPAQQFTQYLVVDPTAKTILMWSSLNKIGQLLHFPSPPSIKADGTAPLPKKDESVPLGHRMILGMLCTGHRTVRTIAAGTIGNASPMTSSREWWMSDDLHMNALEIVSDPQHGERTNQLISLERTEPDAAMFHLPAGYTVHEIIPRGAATAAAAAAKVEQPLDVANAPDVSRDMAIALLSSRTEQEKRSGAAALVKQAQASNDPAVKDDVAYRLGRASVGLPEAVAVAESAVKDAETQCQTQVDFQKEITLARYWHTLGFVYYSQEKFTEAKAYMGAA